MQTLWDDVDFDYSAQRNVPLDMVRECGMDWAQRPDANGLYCPEAELYALFKSRLQRLRGRTLTHALIAGQHMRLVDHARLGICWFGAPGQFRSIVQALQHPWWTEQDWQRGHARISEWGYPEAGLRQAWRRKWLTPRVLREQLALQQQWYAAYCARSAGAPAT